MSYESDCLEYALFGNPEQDHWDYEMNAQHDRWDGYGDPDPVYTTEYMESESHWFEYHAAAGYDEGEDWVQATANAFFEDLM